MKNLLKHIRSWHYRRLYTRLVFAYLKHESTSCGAHTYAAETFKAITGRWYSGFQDNQDA